MTFNVSGGLSFTRSCIVDEAVVPGVFVFGLIKYKCTLLKTIFQVQHQQENCEFSWQSSKIHVESKDYDMSFDPALGNFQIN